MNRELKFRAWHKEIKGFIWNLDYGIIQNITDDGTTIFMTFSQPKNLHIMQYTGLKDKNGVEIYEGDIVESYDSLSIMEVVYNTKWACFELDLKKGTICYEIGDTGYYNVIGNIYKNPELLEDN